MNWFIFATVILYLGGAGQYFKQGNWQLGIVFVAYAIANVAILLI